MKIVVTNESGLSDSHLGELQKLGEVVTYRDTVNTNIVERLLDADVAIIDCFVTPITRELVQRLPNLKFLTINSTGYDKVDIRALQDRRLVASNVPGFSTEAVAEMAIGLLFATVRKISEGDREFREKQIVVDPGTEVARRYLGFEVRGKTLGVIGLGSIGSRVAEIGSGLGMSVIGYNRSPKKLTNVRTVPLDTLMKEADAVIICLALNNETKGLISAEKLRLMKRTAVLVSIASMAIVDQVVLVELLNADLVAGAGLDTADSSMFSVKNTVLTPHMAYNTRESSQNMGRTILENIRGFIEGKPINLISQRK